MSITSMTTAGSSTWVSEQQSIGVRSEPNGLNNQPRLRESCSSLDILPTVRIFPFVVLTELVTMFRANGSGCVSGSPRISSLDTPLILVRERSNSLCSTPGLIFPIVFVQRRSLLCVPLVCSTLFMLLECCSQFVGHGRSLKSAVNQFRRSSTRDSYSSARKNNKRYARFPRVYLPLPDCSCLQKESLAGYQQCIGVG